LTPPDNPLTAHHQQLADEGCFKLRIHRNHEITRVSWCSVRLCAKNEHMRAQKASNLIAGGHKPPPGWHLSAWSALGAGGLRTR
jgi:hypothetical protein